MFPQKKLQNNALSLLQGSKVNLQPTQNLNLAKPLVAAQPVQNKANLPAQFSAANLPMAKPQSLQVNIPRQVQTVQTPKVVVNRVPTMQQLSMPKVSLPQTNTIQAGSLQQKSLKPAAPVKSEMQKFLDTNGNTRLYSGRSANDYINEYNTADAWKQQQIKDNLTKQASRTLDFGDANTANQRDEANTILASLQERGQDKFDLGQKVAQFGSGVAQSMGDLYQNISDSARNSPINITGEKDTQTRIQDAYNKGQIDKQTYIQQMNDAQNRLGQFTGGMQDRGTLDRALRAAGAGFDVATTVVPITSLAKGATVLSQGTKLLSKEGVKQAGTYALKEGLLNAATAAPGALRSGTDTTIGDVASQAAMSGLFGAGMAGAGVAGGAAVRAASPYVRQGIQAVSDAIPTAEKLTLAHPAIQELTMKANDLFTQRDSLIARGMSVNSSAVKQIDKAIKSVGEEYGKTYKKVYEMASQGGFVAGPLAGDFSRAKKQGLVFDGVDGKPRFEVDDSGAKIGVTFNKNHPFFDKNRNFELKEKPTTVGDLLKHDELTKNYPWVKDIKIIDGSAPNASIFEQGSKGGYDPASNTIRMGNTYSQDEYIGTLLHEIQHAIQEKEGFAKGGTPVNGFDKYHNLAGEAEARAVEARMNMPMSERYVKTPAMYHGTAAQFDKFDPSKAGTQKYADWGDGVYFDPRKSGADYYRKEAVAKNSPEVQKAYKNYEDTLKRLGTKPMYESVDLGYGSPKYLEAEKARKAYVSAVEKAKSDPGQGRIVKSYLKKDAKIKDVYVSGVPDPTIGEQAAQEGYDAVRIHTGPKGDPDTFVDEILVLNTKALKDTPEVRSTFYDSLDVPKEDLIVRNGDGKAMSVDDPTAALKQEALKYKTAEEFVKAQKVRKPNGDTSKYRQKIAELTDVWRQANLDKTELLRTTNLPTLKELADSRGYELRRFDTPLGANEQFDKVVKPFDFSENNGGTLDSTQYYNNYYLYPKNGSTDLYNQAHTQPQAPVAHPKPEVTQPKPKTMYHGTQAPINSITDLNEMNGSMSSLFGPGIYLTDNRNIAEGYSKTRGKSSESGKVLEGSIGDARLYNLENTLPPDIASIFKKEAIRNTDFPEDLPDFSKLKGTDAIREIKKLISDSEGVDDFFTQKLHPKLIDKGYDGFSHIGGIQGGEKHNVAILFNKSKLSANEPKPVAQVEAPQPTVAPVQKPKAAFEQDLQKAGIHQPRKISETANQYGNENSSKQILDEAVDMAHSFDKQAKGGQLISKNGVNDAYTGDNGMSRISEHSDFYRQYFKQYGHAPSKQAFREEVMKQLEQGKGNLVEPDQIDAYHIAKSREADIPLPKDTTDYSLVFQKDLQKAGIVPKPRAAKRSVQSRQVKARETSQPMPRQRGTEQLQENRTPAKQNRQVSSYTNDTIELPTVNTNRVGALDKAFRSTRSIIERQGKNGKALAGMLQESRDVEELYQASLIKRMPTVMKLKGKRFENFVDSTQGRAKPMDESVTKAIAEWQAVHPEIRQRAVDAGLDVGDLGTNYYPHFVDYDRIFKDKNTYNEAINHLVKTNQAKSVDEAIKLLSYARDTSRNRSFGNLEASRLVDLPFYDKTPNSFRQYIQSSTRRIAQTEVFGAKDENALKLISKAGLEGFDTEAMKNAYDVAVGAKKYNRSLENASRNIRRYTTTTRLGLGALTNASQSVNTGIVTGHLRTLKAMFKQLDPKTRDFVADTGTIADAVLNDIRSQQGFESFGQKAVGKTINAITAPFFGTVEKFNRSVASTAGRDYALRLAQKGDATSLSILRDKLGVTGEIKNKTLTRTQQIQAARKVVEKTQFKVDAQDLPGWTDSPGGKLVAQFRTFSYSQGKFFSNEVMKPALKGNLAPLARVLAALPVGYALYETRRVIDGRPEEEDKSKVALQSFQKIGGAGLVLDIYNGLNPVGSKYLPSDRRVSMAVGTIGGPSVGTAANAVGAISEAIQRKNTPTDESRLEGRVVAGKTDDSYTDLTALSRFGLQQVPIVGSPIANRVLPYKKQSDADTGKTGNEKLDTLVKSNEDRAAAFKKSFSAEDYKLYSLSKKDRQKLIDNGTYTQEKVDGLMRYAESKKKQLGYDVKQPAELPKNLNASATKLLTDYDAMDSDAKKSWLTQKNTDTSIKSDMQSWVGNRNVQLPDITNEVAKDWADYQKKYAEGKISKLAVDDAKKSIIKKAINSQLTADQQEISSLSKDEINYYITNKVISNADVDKALAVEKQLYDAGIITKETLARKLGTSARGYKTSSSGSSSKGSSSKYISAILAAQKTSNNLKNDTYASLSKLLGGLAPSSSSTKKTIGQKAALKKITVKGGKA